MTTRPPAPAGLEPPNRTAPPPSASARADATAYDRYLAGMDASMRQKVALTAAHLLAAGDLADMGMGSGSGSFALASLYPELDVVGVDLDPRMVALARDRYRLPNLRFVVGDVAAPCFPRSTLEAILDSSVLHHVTSFNDYDRAAALRALAVQAEQLAEHGALVVRDFLDPGPGDVWLDLPDDDGGEGVDAVAAAGRPADPRACSTAALFERFAAEFRALRPAAHRGFPMTRVVPRPGDPALPAGWRRYGCALVHAVEFVLRKDYRADWEAEVREEYTFATQPELEATFAALGLRVLASTPIRNPWILANRFVGRFVLRDVATGEPRDWPATNYVIVGQRVGPGRAVRFSETPATDADRAGASRSLELTHWRRLDPEPGRAVVYDLARRAGLSVDVIPWYRAPGGALRVLARHAHPRPILASARAARAALDGATSAGWVVEPLTVRQGDKPLAQTVEELLETFYVAGADAIVAFSPGATYYPSPGGVQEEVRSVFVEVAPSAAEVQVPASGAFTSAGTLRAIEARQLLRAAQVGGLPDARLELNVYDLLLRHGVAPGAWIGADLTVPDGRPPTAPTSLAALSARPHRRLFRRAAPSDSAGFLDLVVSDFSEHAAGDDAPLATRRIPYVVPARLSPLTVVVACLRRAGDTVWIALDDDDLPAAQCFEGHSELLVAPAWRLPRDVTRLRDAEAFVRDRLARELGVTGGPLIELGGRYHPSPGVTPEVAHPFALAVDAEVPAAREVKWVPLSDAVTGRAALRDGHLRVIALRAAHALRLLDDPMT